MASPEFSVSVDYLRSMEGKLRIGEGVIALCGIISESLGEYCGAWGLYSFYRFTTVNSLILSIGIFTTYYLGLNKYVTFLNCFMTVFINDVVFSILYLISTLMMIAIVGRCSSGMGARVFACIFGAAGTFIVGKLAFSGYQAMHSRRNPSNPDPDAAREKPPPYEASRVGHI